MENLGHFRVEIYRLILDCARLTADSLAVQADAARVLACCQMLYIYLANSPESLLNYCHRYRSGLPISSSRAEGSVVDIANARMRKRRRMRRSPKSAHRVAITQAAALDGRLTIANSKRAAWPPCLVHSPKFTLCRSSQPDANLVSDVSASIKPRR